MAAMSTKIDTTEGEYILMNYCRFGTLESKLMKAAVDMPPANTERWLPESVLWRIFDCLVKAGMAMQCPPRYVPGNAAPGRPPPAPTDGGDLPEVIAPGNGPNAGHYGIVHLDLVGNLPIHFESFNAKFLPPLSSQ